VQVAFAKATAPRFSSDGVAESETAVRDRRPSASSNGYGDFPCAVTFAPMWIYRDAFRRSSADRLSAGGEFCYLIGVPWARTGGLPRMALSSSSLKPAAEVLTSSVAPQISEPPRLVGPAL
jgi:hypothetical protein